MPIGASAGTLDIENATLRSNAIAVLTNLVTGNDAVRSSGAPTLEVYGDPSNGGNEARLELVSNLSVENSKSFTRLTSNAGVFSIQSGTDATTNGPITFGGFSNERLRITSDGNVGIGTTNPVAPLQMTASGGLTNSLLHKYLGTGPASAACYVLLLQPTTVQKRLIGKIYGVRNATSLSNAFEADLIIGTGNNNNIDSSGLTFKYIGTESFYGKLVTLTYNSLTYIALGLYPSNERGMTGGIYFEGKTSHTDDLVFIKDLGTLSNITDYTPTEADKTTFTGDVGIGTDNPNAKLDVQGSAVITGLTYGIKSTGTLGSDKTEGWYRLLIGGVRSGSNAIRTKCKLQVEASGLHQSLTFDFNHMISLSQTSGNSFNLLGNDHYISRVGVTKLRLADAGSNQFALDMYIDHDVVPIDREWDITLYTEGGSIISEASTFLEKITATPSASIEIGTDTTIFGIVGSTTSETLVMHENGNVGIGVTGPQTTLDVNGTIKNTNPAFWAYTSGGATTTLAGIFDGGGSPARALFSSTDLNIGSCYSTSNGRFTAPVAGRYAFFGQVLLRRGSNTGHVSSELTLYKNGTNVNGRGLAYSTVSNDSGEHDNLRLFYILDLAKDQYVQIGMYSIGTGSDVYYGERLANFSGYLLG
jgi:hypothetical protein